MEDVRVLISVLNWNNWKSTAAAINSINKILYKNYTIIISDNNSQDDSCIQLKSKFPDIIIWEFKKNLGYAGAHKKVAQYALKNNFELLWILNNDVEVFPSTLTELVNSYKRNGNCLYGSLSLQKDAKSIHFGGGLEILGNTVDQTKPYNQYEGKKYAELELEERPVSDIEGASFIIPTEIIRNHGFLDTRFFLYGEETAYCYKLRSKCDIQSLIIPKAVVIHRSSESFTVSSKLPYIKAYYMTRNTHFFHRKYFGVNYLKKEGTIMDLMKFFFKHLFNKKEEQTNQKYWMKYYTKLGYFHAIVKLRGKYLEPNKFL